MERKQYEALVKKTLDALAKQRIAVTAEEAGRIEVADFGLGRPEESGLQLLTYVNTDRCCAKELVLFPYQTCPEHLHPSLNGVAGKEETFRCRAGEVYLYVDGEKSHAIHARLPKGVYTVFHEIHLTQGQQYTMKPDTRHWFQAGPDGCVVSEFSTHNNDDTDLFTDSEIVRTPCVPE